MMANFADLPSQQPILLVQVPADADAHYQLAEQSAEQHATNGKDEVANVKNVGGDEHRPEPGVGGDDEEEVEEKDDCQDKSCKKEED